MTNRLLLQVRRIIVLAFATGMSLAFLPMNTAFASPTSESGASIGVIIDPAPTTTPPVTVPATTVPHTTTPPTTAPATTAPVTTLPPTTDAPTTAVVQDPEDSYSTVPAPAQPPTFTFTPPTPPPPPAIQDHGFIAKVRSAAGTVKSFASDVLSGTPVADVVQRLLPTPVAMVVVPAVRTASTFSFPIGLSMAVFGFLILQQRIDHGDPKLVAAPIGHDDDVVTFR